MHVHIDRTGKRWSRTLCIYSVASNQSCAFSAIQTAACSAWGVISAFRQRAEEMHDGWDEVRREIFIRIYFQSADLQSVGS